LILLLLLLADYETRRAYSHCFVGFDSTNTQEEGGQLTEAVRRNPHSVVLFDELEKAHGDVLNILLQVIEDGILTDGQGSTVSFKNTVIVMTSNIGSKQLLEAVRESNQGDESDDATTTKSNEKAAYAKLAAVVKRELEVVLKPEFLNRIDDIVIFQPLTEHELSLIATMMILDIVARTQRERHLDITVSGALLEKMVRDGSKTASQFGARPMRRTVQRILEDTISEAVVDEFLVEGDVAVFDLRESDNEDDDEDDTGSFFVSVSRERDDETFLVEIEQSTRDIESLVPVEEPKASTEELDEEKDQGTNGAEPAYLIASDS